MSRTKKREVPRPEPSVAPAAAAPSGTSPALAFLNRWSLVITIVLMAIGTVRIALTYTIFNHTVDESGNIACGIEWMEKGIYQWEAQHPPLARVCSAFLPYLTGSRGQGTRKTDLVSLWHEGTRILYAGHHYDQTLALARAGMLPFFWVGCLAVYFLGRRYFSPAVGALAASFFSFTPPILAHAGLTNEDMALTAFLTAAFFAGLVWAEEPTKKHALWFGVTTGFMVVSKFTCLAFFPAALGLVFVGYLAGARPSLSQLLQAAKQRVPTFGMAVGIAIVLIWAAYRFSFGPVNPGGMSVPAPELFRGFQEVQSHLGRGHETYLLGEIGRNGFWDFYPVALGVKTPLGLLLLAFIGIGLAFTKYPPARRLWIPLLYALGVLLVGMFSTVNIGVRHVLPVYVGFAVAAAVAVMKLWELGQSRKWAWGALGVLVAWFAASSILSHPDYLPYFNEIAGSEPEKILVDSDLDWGQDLKRLAARLKQAGATSVAYNGFDYADLEKEHGFPPVHGMNPRAPLEGWNSVSITCWKELRVVTWPDQIPAQERVGKGMLLWYFPPANSKAPRNGQ